MDFAVDLTYIFFFVVCLAKLSIYRLHSATGKRMDYGERRGGYRILLGDLREGDCLEDIILCWRTV